MPQIVTNLGHLNVAGRISQSAQNKIIQYVNSTNSLQVVVNTSISVKNERAVPARAQIPTQWTVELRIDLASPRAGAHGGVECPHAQVTDARRHGGPAPYRVAHDRMPSGQSIRNPRVNYDRVRIPEAYPLNSVEASQICRSTTILPHGIMLWLKKTLIEHFINR